MKSTDKPCSTAPIVAATHARHTNNNGKKYYIIMQCIKNEKSKIKASEH